MASWATLLLVLWCGMVFWKGSDSGLPHDSALLFLASGAGISAWWIAWLRYEWRRARHSTQPRSMRLAYCALGPLLILAVSWAWLSGAVFRVRFAQSEAALHRYVTSTSLRDSDRLTTPVGSFTVREVEKLPGGMVRLITCRDGFMDDAGIVYYPVGPPPEIAENYYRHISGPWWHWRRSW